MNPVVVVAVLVALVALASGLGVLHRATAGRARTISGAEQLSLDGVALGERATLLQFSTEVCTPCRSTARVLGEVADRTDAVRHVDFDITNRPDVAARFNVLQTPTTLIVDGSGAIRARIGGAVRRDVVAAELDRVLTAA